VSRATLPARSEEEPQGPEGKDFSADRLNRRQTQLAARFYSGPADCDLVNPASDCGFTRNMRAFRLCTKESGARRAGGARLPCNQSERRNTARHDGRGIAGFCTTTWHRASHVRQGRCNGTGAHPYSSISRPRPPWGWARARVSKWNLTKFSSWSMRGPGVQAVSQPYQDGKT